MNDVIKPTQPPTLVTNDGAADHVAATKALAHVMDAAFTIPGTNVRVGLDSLLGLIPVVGDTIGSLVGGYIVLVAAKLGVPRVVLWRMMLNLGVDAAVGIVPFAGDLLDVGWKANLKNAALLERALQEPQATRRSSAWVVAGLAAAFVGIVAGAVALGVLLVRWIF